MSRPGPVRNWTMPTDREMQGDFSQTLDSQGRLIFIRDPLATGACNAVTGGPACFPGNIIPANRINSNGKALLNMLPRANNFDRSFTQGQFNYTTQENAENPKMNNIVRVDWKPSSHDSLYFTFKDWYSDQRGSEITAGPTKWGFFNTHYLNTDRGVSANHAKILSPTMVLESDFGIRQQTEQFYPLTEADWTRINRDTIGFTVGQFHPELNPRNVIPKVTFNVPNAPNFTFDNRLVDQGEAWLTSFRTKPDVDSRQPLTQGRLLLRAVAELGRQRRRRRGPVGGAVQLQHRRQQSRRHQLQLRQRPARNVPRLYRNRRVLGGHRQALHQRVLCAGHVEANRRLTLDYGVRFLWYTPWYSSQPAAVFVPERYDPAKAPRLYQPAVVNGANVALDPVTGQTLPNVYVGSFVPGTGDRYNGMVSSSRSELPERVPRQPGHRAGAAAGLGVGRAGRREDRRAHERRAVSQPARQRERHGRDGAESAGAEHAQHLLRDAWTRCWPRARRGILEPSEQRVRHRARREDAEELQLFRGHPARARLGHGDRRHLRRVPDAARRDVHATSTSVPDGARFLDVQSGEPESAEPTTAKPPEFLRPVSGLPGHHDPIALRHRALQLAAGAAESPLHQRPAVRGRLHAGEDRQPGTERRSAELHPEPARGRLERRRRTSRRSSTTSSSTTRGTCPNGSRHVEQRR